MHLRCVHFTVGKLFLKKKFQGKCKVLKMVRSLSEAFLLYAVITCDVHRVY